MKLQLKQTLILTGTLLGIACFQVLLAFQGFDLCDEGFTLTFFQQIFNDPQSVEYNFLYWLSGVVGGVWLKIMPDAGIFSFRILGIAMHLLGLVLVIAIFQKRLPAWVIAIACVVLTVMFDFGVVVFEHSHLVVVLALAAFYFLMMGMERNRWWALTLGGFMLAVNVFSRLPNLTLWAWILLIPLFTDDWRKTFRQLGYVCIGLVAGVAAIFITMLALGHVEIFTRSVSMMFDIAGRAENSHSLTQLSGTIVDNYKYVGKNGAIFIGLGGVIFTAFLLFKKLQWWKYAVSAVLLGGLWFWMHGKPGVFWLYALCFIAQGFLFRKTDDKMLRKVILGSVLMMVLLPLGSNFYMGNMGLYSIWLAVPLALWWGFSSMETSPIFNQTKQWFFVAFLCAFGICQLTSIANQAYFDKGSRLDKRHAINHPIAKNIFTTRLRADVMNHFIPTLHRYISPNNYVLAFEHIPMIHALTQSRPYLYSPWPAYDSETFARQLARAERTLPLPIVVAQHFESFPDWSAPQDDYFSEDKPNDYKHHSGRTAAFNAFLQRHNYQQVWTNGFFSIWVVD